MSAQAFTWALERRTGSPSAKAVLLALANYSGDAGQCFPSLKTLAKDTEQSVDSVRRRISDLQAAGFIAIFERQRSSGAQTSSEYVVLYSDDARRYAQGMGWEPTLRRNPTQQILDVEPPLADCEGGGVADCEGAPSTAARGPLALVLPHEPSLEPSSEILPPTPQGGEGGGLPIVGSEKEQAPQAPAWEADWRAFDAAYPWQLTDLKAKGKEAFTALPPDDRAAAIRYASGYAAACKASNRKVLNAARWIAGRGWEVLADAEKAQGSAQAARQAQFAGKMWVEAGTPQAAAWRRHKGGALPFYYKREAFDGKPGFGRAEDSEWPPRKTQDPEPATSEGERAA